MTITLTEDAKEHIKNEKQYTNGIRFLEKREGCSGYKYVFSSVDMPQENETAHTIDGITVYIQNDLLPKVTGAEIYFDSELKVLNPNIKKTCTCGRSHSY